MSVQKPEKKSEQKSEKVEQELQTKLEEKQKNPKQETPETQESKEQQKTEEEPLSMELSGLNEDALSMMGISKKEVADALRNLDTGTWIFQCNRSTVFGTDAGTIFRRKIQYGLPAYLCRWRKWNSAGGCTNKTDDGLF